MLVKPLIEKTAEQVARARAAIRVAALTVTLLWRSVVGGAVTPVAGRGVTLARRLRLFAR
jgi:hypothetical protein